MPKGPVGTMDTVGFLTEPSVKIDRALAYWFANRIDQCIVLRDIKSYQYVTAKHQDDKKGVERFLTDVKDNLTAYLLQIFDGVTIETKANRANEEDKMFTLLISGVVNEDGRTYDLASSTLINGETYKLIDKGRALNG